MHIDIYFLLYSQKHPYICSDELITIIKGAKWSSKRRS